LEESGDFRLRVGMANPHHVMALFDALMPLFEDDRLYKFLHIPAQSGSDIVLKRMKRAYTAQQYESLVQQIRSRVPDMTLATDWIVGFPGETAFEFQETVSLAERTLPAISNISRYSARPGTPAASMPGTVPPIEKKRRSTRLYSVCKAISLNQNQSLVGKTFAALVSEIGPKGGVVARTNAYKAIALPREGTPLLGKFVQVRVLEAREGYAVGELA